MNESKHTPGPWEWVKRTYYHDLVGANGVVVCSDGSAAGEYGPDIDVTGPDARLMRASPELLEALKDAHRWVGRLTDWTGAGDPDIDMWRAAIAKATEVKND